MKPLHSSIFESAAADSLQLPRERDVPTTFRFPAFIFFEVLVTCYRLSSGDMSPFQKLKHV